MTLWSRFRSWVLAILRRSRIESEMDAELRFHIAAFAEDLVRSGVPRQEALRRARIEFGGIERAKEECREARGVNFIESLIQDLRYGLRMLRKSPGFTFVAILTLALGIGANTAIFSILEAVLFRPLPYRDPGRLVVVADPEAPQHGGFLYKDFETSKSQLRSFENIAIYYRNTGISRVTLTGAGEPEAVKAAFVSADFFRTMGIWPELGRTFTSEEELHQVHVVVLSHGLWLRRFGGSPEVIGKDLQIDGVESKVIGVMPASFQFPDKHQEFWAPITTNRSWQEAALTTKIDPTNTRLFYARWLVVGRLKTGVSFLQAQAEIDSLFAHLAQSDPDPNRSLVRVFPLGLNLSDNTRLALFVLFGAVISVLLIACSNVANLVLARGAGRTHEMALRTAFGAGRGRLTRQLFTESALLALVSGCLGLLLASFCLHTLIAFGPPDIPRLDEARVDARVLGFALAISLLTAVVFGLVPAWRISQSDPQKTLKGAFRSASGSLALRRMRNALVVLEFALAIVLLTGAGLLVRSFLALEEVDLGFQPERLLTMRVTMPADVSQPRRIALHEETLERAAALPGVKAVGAISDLFELGDLGNLGLRAIEGREPEPPDKWTPLIWQTVSGDYLYAMGALLLRGRVFSQQDTANSPLVALIDENMARRYWSSEDPIGKRFKGQDPRGRNDGWITVIGVVGNMRRNGLQRDPVPHIFEWYKQSGSTPRDLVVRTTGAPRIAAATLRSLVRSLDPVAILSPVTTMSEQLSEQLSSRRFQTSLLALFSLIALILATVGIFALMHYTVAQRTQEIGIRMALGARRSDIMRFVIREGALLALAGVSIGIFAALALTRLISSLLFGVGASDPATFVGVAALLMVFALVGCYVPASRAMRVDPMVALRYE
ncbi:MAG: hypothetical protein DMG36_13550 [Acidobacteria bacterium]|nr:MAG: hypothetical protein DMG36_13550 [Acidobacteriota bacterium]